MPICESWRASPVAVDCAIWYCVCACCRFLRMPAPLSASICWRSISMRALLASWQAVKYSRCTPTTSVFSTVATTCPLLTWSPCFTVTVFTTPLISDVTSAMSWAWRMTVPVAVIRLACPSVGLLLCWVVSCLGASSAVCCFVVSSVVSSLSSALPPLFSSVKAASAAAVAAMMIPILLIMFFISSFLYIVQSALRYARGLSQMQRYGQVRCNKVATCRTSSTLQRGCKVRSKV